MSDEFASAWKVFLRELGERNLKLRAEIEACWNSVGTILQDHAGKLDSTGWPGLPDRSLPSVTETVQNKGRLLLFDPVRSLKKARPMERVLSIADRYRTDIEDVLRLLPETLVVSRKELAGYLSQEGQEPAPPLTGSGKKPRTFHVRNAARTVLENHVNARINWDGRMIRLLAEASISLLTPWELYRNDALSSCMDAGRKTRDLSKSRQNWLQKIASFRIQAEKILAAYGLLEKQLSDRLPRALKSNLKSPSARRSARFRKRWQSGFSHWSALKRTVTVELDLEYSSGQLLETAAGVSADHLASVDEERAQVLDELDKVRHWLELWRLRNQTGSFPDPEARLTASEERVSAWNKKISLAVRAVLPVRVELIDTQSIFPGSRPSPRSLEPAKSLAESVDAVGCAIALNGFRKAEEGHRGVIREIERAREVVAYSMEGDPEEKALDSEIAEEGIRNALSLLNYQKDSMPDFHPVVERYLVEALAASFYEYHLGIDENKLGLYGYLARERGGRAFRAGALSLYKKMKTVLRLARDRIVVLRDRLLILVGWAPPPTTAVDPVVRKEYLGELLRLNVVPRELPALYKRLFRLQPLEDPRFLVGRDVEIAAMAQARRQWEEGRAVSVLLAGARGSGKTSLLNCAHMAIFSDLEVVRGQFSRRITDPAELHVFLASLFKTEAHGLHTVLSSGKRLVILEEVERTFLRKIGGFTALRALLDLVSATSRNNLWILSLNHAALKFLDDVISMEENFSHKINAMAVAPEHLTEAILLRHNLSGFRLELMSPKTERSRMDGVKHLLGLEMNPEQSYFDALYRQSQGVFRSAFELWLQSVDRIEGGVLYMLRPAQPDYGKMLSQLTLEDTFRLQSILQHGGLTVEELAGIFDEPVERSKRSTEKLLGWDVLEEDPNGPGFRVRPAAGRFARSALYRQNLL